MKGHGEKLSRNQDGGIAGLLVHPGMSRVATAADIGEVTLWRWMQIPEFKEQYRLAKREASGAPGSRTPPERLQRCFGGSDRHCTGR
jgi:hypothetical protein